MDYLDRNEEQKDETYQKVAYLYGIMLLKQGNLAEAVKKFDLSLGTPLNPEFQAHASFWKAEALYRFERYESALTEFKGFAELPAAKSIEEYDYFHYNLAYTFFQLGDYNQAGGHFNEFIEEGKRPDLVPELFQSRPCL